MAEFIGAFAVSERISKNALRKTRKVQDINFLHLSFSLSFFL